MDVPIEHRPTTIGTAGAARTAGARSPGGLGGMAEALRGLIDQLADAAKTQGKTAADRSGESQEEPGRSDHAARPGGHTVGLGAKAARMVFGYTVRVGLNGISAEPFGDVSDGHDSPRRRHERHGPDRDGADRGSPGGPRLPAEAAARQPIVDVFEEPDAIVVVAELPGADPTGLVCHPDDHTLLIETTGSRRYRKHVALPGPVSADGMTHSFRNGILEVRLARMQGE